MLEVLDENSHCLQRANKLRIYYDDVLEWDVAELIDKLSSLVTVETVVHG